MLMFNRLLLGIDIENKHITCGLVDTIGRLRFWNYSEFLNEFGLIGSYTLAKTLEYKAKHGLHSTKDVTVIPPAEYEERFVNALEGYFVACPGGCRVYPLFTNLIVSCVDKWSKPLDEGRVPSCVDQLHSVF